MRLREFILKESGLCQTKDSSRTIDTTKENHLVLEFIRSSYTNKMIIFGEMHNQLDRDRIVKHIRNIHKTLKIDYILSEEIGNSKYINTIDKLNAIEQKMYSVGPESLKLSIELDIPIIGIDNWSIDTSTMSKADAFATREDTMFSVMSDYLNSGTVVVIVGDTHLRTEFTKELGPSSILNNLTNNGNVIIIRSPNPEVL